VMELFSALHVLVIGNGVSQYIGREVVEEEGLHATCGFIRYGPLLRSTTMNWWHWVHIFSPIPF
jgi:hypothetical protein